MATDRESPFEFFLYQAPDTAGYPICKDDSRDKKILIYVFRQRKTMVQIDGQGIIPRYTFVTDYCLSIGFFVLQQLMCSQRTRNKFLKDIGKALSSVGVTEQKYHSLVYEKLFNMAKSGVFPGLPIRVHVTENMPSITLEGLETVELDASILEQTPSCTVCMEDFLCFDVQDENDDQIFMATRLPCGHHFHGHCIVNLSSRSRPFPFAPSADTQC